jgi:hypothetical protein
MSWKNKFKGKITQREEKDVDEIKFKEEIRSKKAKENERI